MRAITRSDVPIVDGHRLAARIFETGTYAALLKLPSERATLEILLGLDPRNPASPSLERVVPLSDVTGRPRRLAYYRTRTTRVWFAETLDPVGVGEGEGASHPRETRILFHLPNGAPAFAVYDPAGRLAWGEQATAPPTACQSCHASGPIAPRSERAAAEGTGEELPSGSLAARILAEMESPVSGNDGVDDVSALIARYWAPLDLQRAAAEVALTAEAVARRLADAGEDRETTVRALAAGAVSRAAFERLLPRLAGFGLPENVSVTRSPAGPEDADAGRPEIAVWPERASVKPGDELRFHLSATRPCFPTLIGRDGFGRAVVLFPSGFEAPRQLRPGEVVTVPDPEAEYFIRADHVGSETVLAFCSGDDKPILGMRIDYQRQVFPLLGDWETFLGTAHAAMQEPRIEPRRSRRGHVRPEDIPLPLPRRLARAMATYVVSP